MWPPLGWSPRVRLVCLEPSALIRQRIEQSFKDNKSRSRLAGVRVGASERSSRLLMAPTIALSWLTLIAVRGVDATPHRWHASVAERERASAISLALALLDHLGTCHPSAYRDRPEVVGMR